MYYLASLRINRVRIFPYVRYRTELAVIKKAKFMENFLRRKCLSEETFNLFNSASDVNEWSRFPQQFQHG
jgi:hypothetical protein